MATGRELEKRLADLRRAKNPPAKRAPRGVLPLAAFYRGELEQERRRAEFYALMADKHGWGWRLDPTSPSLRKAKPGFDGRAPSVVRSSIRRTESVNRNAAPLEHLAETGNLRTGKDRNGATMTRKEAGERARADMEGAEISGLRSPSLESMGQGGAGRPVSDYKLDCLKAVGGLRAFLPARLMMILEDVVHRDVWPWEGAEGKERRAILEMVHHALDFAALYYRLLPLDAFVERWPDSASRARKHFERS